MNKHIFYHLFWIAGLAWLLSSCVGAPASPTPTIAPLPSTTPVPIKETAVPTDTPTTKPTETATLTPIINIEADPLTQFLMKADKAYQAGDYEQAIQIYTQMLESNPEQTTISQIYTLRADAYEQLHDYDAAIADYKTSIELGEEAPGVFNNLCWDLGLTGQAEEALPYCEKAVQLESKPSYRDSRGLAYAQLGRYEDAMADFQTVVDDLKGETDPELASIYAERLAWIDILKAGQNPITPEVLAQLRGEVEKLTQTVLPTPTSPSSGQVTAPGETTATGRIVFESIGERNDIYIVNPDGSNLSPLANTADMEASPVGSPDGRHIAFVHVPAGKEPYEGMDIWVMDTDGSNIVPVTNVFGGEGAPSWSPDSSQIAFKCETWRIDICVINTDGSQSTQLTTDENSMYQMSLVTDLLTARHWSPDGNTIVFMESLDGVWGIARINKDGSGYASLTTDLPSADPTWSPDGTRIAFVRAESRDCEDDCNMEIYLMNPDGGDLTNVTNDPALDYNPVWSPDGRKIAFLSHRDGNDEMYVLDLESNELTRITDNPAFDGQPTWSPDGLRLAFTSDRDGTFDIFVVDIDGENLIRLTTNETDDYSPYWLPN